MEDLDEDPTSPDPRTEVAVTPFMHNDDSHRNLNVYMTQRLNKDESSETFLAPTKSLSPARNFSRKLPALTHVKTHGGGGVVYPNA